MTGKQGSMGGLTTAGDEEDFIVCCEVKKRKEECPLENTSGKVTPDFNKSLRKHVKDKAQPRRIEQ